MEKLLRFNEKRYNNVFHLNQFSLNYDVDIGPRFFKDLKIFMIYPFFVFSSRCTPITYHIKEHRSKYIQLTPTNGHNIASLYDWNVLIFAISVYHSLPERFKRTGEITFIRNKLVEFMQKHSNHTTFSDPDITMALNRLQHTKIKTNILGKKYIDSEFSFIDNWEKKIQRDPQKRQKACITIKFSQCMIDLLNRTNSTVNIDPLYFKLSSPREKFFYRIAKVFLGKKKFRLSIDVEYLHSVSEIEKYSHFVADLRKTMKRLSAENGFVRLVNYRVDLVEEHNEKALIFSQLMKEDD